MGIGIAGANLSVAKNIANAAAPVLPVLQELPQHPMTSLRPELKALVAKNLNVQENKNMRLMDKSFRQAGAFQLRAFKVPANEIANLTRILAVAENLPKIDKIEITGFSDSVGPKLRQLAAVDIACLEKITHLTLPELAVNDRTPNRLQDLTPPEVLKLKNCPGYVKALQEEETRVQEEETRVQELFLLPIQAITDAGLLQLQSIGQLRALDLGTCSAITGAGLAHLQRLT